MNGGKRSKRELLSSDESDCEQNASNSDSDGDFQRSKKSKKSKHLLSDEDVSSEAMAMKKRPSRRGKENEDDRQMRLAIEQSVMEEETRRLRTEELINKPDSDHPASLGIETIGAEVETIGAKLDSDHPASLGIETIGADVMETFVETKLNEIVIDLSIPAKVVDTKSTENKGKKPRQKLSALMLNSDSSGDEDLTSAKKKPKKKTPPKKKKETPGKRNTRSKTPSKNSIQDPDTELVSVNPDHTENEAKKPRKKLTALMLNSDSSGDEDFDSAKKKPKKKTPPKKKKETATKNSAKKSNPPQNTPKDLDPTENTESPEIIPKPDQQTENKENTCEPLKENDSSESPVKTADQDENKTVSIPKNTSNSHNLLPKHVSRLPPKNTTKPAFVTKLEQNEQTKPVTNPTIKALAKTAGPNTSSASTSSPLGRIEIKNNSPCVRVGLSRNSRIPPLHKNVKPAL